MAQIIIPQYTPPSTGLNEGIVTGLSLMDMAERRRRARRQQDIQERQLGLQETRLGLAESQEAREQRKFDLTKDAMVAGAELKEAEAFSQLKTLATTLQAEADWKQIAPQAIQEWSNIELQMAASGDDEDAKFEATIMATNWIERYQKLSETKGIQPFFQNAMKMVDMRKNSAEVLSTLRKQEEIRTQAHIDRVEGAMSAQFRAAKAAGLDTDQMFVSSTGRVSRGRGTPEDGELKTKKIKFDDGLDVEVDVTEDEYVELLDFVNQASQVDGDQVALSDRPATLRRRAVLNKLDQIRVPAIQKISSEPGSTNETPLEKAIRASEERFGAPQGSARGNVNQVESLFQRAGIK